MEVSTWWVSPSRIIGEIWQCNEIEWKCIFWDVQGALITSEVDFIFTENCFYSIISSFTMIMWMHLIWCCKLRKYGFKLFPFITIKFNVLLTSTTIAFEHKGLILNDLNTWKSQKRFIFVHCLEFLMTPSAVNQHKLPI